jgi:hypothetical protein
MVAHQILVLPVQVRILVGQQKKSLLTMQFGDFFYAYCRLSPLSLHPHRKVDKGQNKKQTGTKNNYLDETQ